MSSFSVHLHAYEHIDASIDHYEDKDKKTPYLIITDNKGGTIFIHGLSENRLAHIRDAITYRAPKTHTQERMERDEVFQPGLDRCDGYHYDIDENLINKVASSLKK